MNNHFISIKIAKKNWERHWVNDTVYLYIRQLESAIQYPELLPQLRKFYPKRFKERKIEYKSLEFYE